MTSEEAQRYWKGSFYIPGAFKNLLLSRISKMFLQNNVWYSRFVVLFTFGVIYLFS